MGERETEAENEKRERGRVRSWRQRGCGRGDPSKGSGGGRGSWQPQTLFPLHPLSACCQMFRSDANVREVHSARSRPWPAGASAAVWGGELGDGNRPACSSPVPPGSRDWTTWWGVGDTRRLRGPLLQAESRDLQRQSGAPASTWTHPCVQVSTCVEAHGHRRTDPHGCTGVRKATRGPRRSRGTTAPTMALLCWSPCSAWSPSPEPGL